MRVTLYFLLWLALASLAAYQAQEQDHPCQTLCAPTNDGKDFTGPDGTEYKSCACEASKGKGCDGKGNRNQEGTVGCVNHGHCRMKCCGCCPRD